MNGAIASFFASIGLTILCIAAWITHVIVCIKTGSILFLIAGALLFPIAVIHGVGCWFNAW